MVEEKISNKLITTIFAVIIIIAAVVILYVNLPEDKNEKQTNDETGQEEEEEEQEEEEPEEEEPEYVFNLTFEDNQTNYTLEGLESLESYNCNATMIKVGFLPEVVIEGPNEFTGIKISTLLNQIEILPENYNISVKTSDGWIIEYNMSEIEGNLDIYNESGVVINNTGATMMLAYKMNGENLLEGEGPLRIIFCHDEFYTPSLYWVKLVTSIEVIEL